MQSRTGTAPGRVGPLRPGDPRRVGGYKLTGLLGEGGMGQVFLGRSRSGRLVAVKLIRPEYARQPRFRERFAREIAAARMVGGFHAVPVVDADPRAERPWMATAYIAAPSLQDRVDTGGPLGTGQVARVGAHLAEGLAAIHACGLVHRDLKPGNVLLAADGARIIDFGIARAVGAVTLTTAGTMLGTCLYMSPEQMREAAISAASDIFSLGSVLTFAATGAPPFRATTLPGIVRDIMDADPDLADVPDPLVPLIAACLAKGPAGRPSLDNILAHCATFARPAPRPASARPPSARAASARPASAQAAGTRATSTRAAGVRPVRARPAAPPPAAPVRKSAAQPGAVPRRVLLAGGVAAVVAAGAVFPLLAKGSTGQPAGSPSPAGVRPRRGTQGLASARSRPAVISRVLVPGPSGLAAANPDSAVLSPDGSTIAFSTSGTGGAKVWLLDAQAVPDLDAYSLTFSPDGRTLALVGYGEPVGGVVRLLDAASLRVVATAALPGEADVTAAAAAGFTPDGTVLAGYSVASDAVAWLMQAGTLKVIASEWLGPASDVTGLAVDLSADGKTLMVAYTSRRVRSGRIQLYQIQPG